MIIVLCSVVGLSMVLVALMLSHTGDPYERLEHEVETIQRRAARGWSTRRIRRHHPHFCVCQIDYLSRRPRHHV